MSSVGGGPSGEPAQEAGLCMRIVSSKTARGEVPIVAQQVLNLTSIHDNAGLIPGLAQWVKDPALP